MDSSNTRKIGEDGKFAWSIENWDGDEWEEIPEYLFTALNRFEDEIEGRQP